MKPRRAHLSDFDSSPGSRSTISLEIRNSRGNSALKTLQKSLGQSMSSPATNTKRKDVDPIGKSQSTPRMGLDKEDVPSSDQQLSESEKSNKSDVSDISKCVQFIIITYYFI